MRDVQPITDTSGAPQPPHPYVPAVDGIVIRGTGTEHDPAGPSATGGSGARVGLILAAWLVAALTIVATGLLARSPVPPPAVAVVLSAAVLLLVLWAPGARDAVRGLGLAPLVAVHLVRVLAGAYFLVLYGQGVLPGEFALAAGWGDIAVGVAALPVLLLCLPVRSRRQRSGLLIWNAIGLVDILGVLANGARLFGRDPAFGELFTALPLAVLPLFVVPVVIVAHVLVFAWAPRPSRDGRHPFEEVRTCA